MALSSERSPLLPAEPATERPHAGAVSAEPHDRKACSSSLASSAGSSSSSADLGDTLRDVIIGFSDGLTVPFALTAGLSSLGSTRLVILGGLAELFSGMISMGLGAYLAAVTERDRQRSSWRRLAHEDEEQELGPAGRAADVVALLARYGVSPAAARPLAEELAADRARWLRFKLDLAADGGPPPARAACLSGLTMGASYFVGGLIPMLPYFFARRVRDALLLSVAVTVAVLLAFGYAKDFLAVRSHRAGAWGALHTLAIGLLAAGTSYLIVKALDAGGSA